MKKYVKDLKANDSLEKELFAISEIQLHKTRAGDPYYNIKLQDKTGEIMGKVWADNIETTGVANLARGDVVEIWGMVQEYQRKLQINIKAVNIPKEFDASLLMKVTDKDIDEMWSELLGIIGDISNNHLKTLLKNIFEDEVISAKFRSYYAGESVHHDFVGGLLEHTLEMIDYARPYSKYYKEADFDLINTGILLHDIGKLVEMQQVGNVFEFTTEGSLIGHINLGIELINSKKPENFPRKLWVHLEHIILSHHGDFSNIKPATIEAAIVSVVDLGSSRVRQYQKEMEQGKDKPEDISQYSKYLDSRVYIGDRDWDETDKDN